MRAHHHRDRRRPGLRRVHRVREQRHARDRHCRAARCFECCPGPDTAARDRPRLDQARHHAWRVSITLEVDFCLDAVDDALARHGRPKIFNTDQGSQFTSAALTGVRSDRAIRISMDGRGSWRDNVLVERLWCSVKYEEVYLRAYDSVAEARSSTGGYLTFYNRKRPHSLPVAGAATSTNSARPGRSDPRARLGAWARCRENHRAATRHELS